MPENYWKPDRLPLFSVPYAYVDAAPLLAISLFQKKQIRPRFKHVLGKEDSPYKIVFCKVRKRDVAKFEEAMEELKNKMLLLGYRDYGQACSDVGLLIQNCNQ